MAGRRSTLTNADSLPGTGIGTGGGGGSGSGSSNGSSGGGGGGGCGGGGNSNGGGGGVGVVVGVGGVVGGGDPLRELFEACKTGDLIKVKALITPKTVNARDTAGRKSTPLHFAAGEFSSSSKEPPPFRDLFP